jgi:hypothetical protein
MAPWGLYTGNGGGEPFESLDHFFCFLPQIGWKKELKKKRKKITQGDKERLI